VKHQQSCVQSMWIILMMEIGLSYIKYVNNTNK